MDNLDYIESYFKKELVTGDAREFEERIESDPAFAEEVAFYLSARVISREVSQTEKKQRFREIYQNKRVSVTPVRKLVYYLTAAAAVACIVFGTYIFTKPVSTRELADRYIKENLQTLGVTMSSHGDSIQTGLRLYNDGKTSEALTIFEKISQNRIPHHSMQKNMRVSAHCA